MQTNEMGEGAGVAGHTQNLAAQSGLGVENYSELEQLFS